jgi:hypothetical protein
MSRLTRLRATAFPNLRDTTNPTFLSSAGKKKFSHIYPARFGHLSERTENHSAVLVFPSLAASGRVSGFYSSLTVRRDRPFARLRFRISRPFFDDILALKPCLFRRFLLLG